MGEVITLWKTVLIRHISHRPKPEYAQAIPEFANGVQYVTNTI